MTLTKLVSSLKRVAAPSLLALMLVSGGQAVIGVETAQAQEAQKKKRATKKVESVNAKNAKVFEKAQEAFEAENYAEV